MNSHPLYERPAEDQGRDNRTDEWTQGEITDFLEERYDEPLEEFNVDNYEELNQLVDQLGLVHDEDSDWRHKQIADLGKENFDYEIACYPMVLEEDEERPPKPDDYVPAKVKFKDENEVVQIKYER